jgi:SAM-dependent methyltransferase
MTSRPGKWKSALRLFFAERAASIGATPDIEQLCYVSGREPRLWSQPAIYEDMIESIIGATRLNARSEVLEVGCAAGFIAKGLAPKVHRYVGVDLAKPALQVARRLQLPNAEFRHAEGGKLPFPDGTFDAALCYDVFTNFPSFEDGIPIISDMLRVVKRGANVLIGSIPDDATKHGYPERISEVTGELERRYGAVRDFPESPPGLITRLDGWLQGAKPGITCYYFSRNDFVALGTRLGAEVTITDIHKLNPYRGFRFNAVFTKRMQ